MLGYIYKTTCWLDGRVYIGQKRGKFSGKYLGSGKHLRLAIANYGRDNFTSELIQYGVSQEEMDKLECCCISTAKSILGEDRVFNISEGGLKGINLKGKNNPMYGSHRTGDKNPNWRGGVCSNGSYFGECECGRRIRKESKHCKSCVGKIRNNAHYIRMAGKRGTPWNKGLTKETDSRVSHMAKKKKKVNI